ncbi:MAG TPA: hypothetical protein GXX31_02480 [Methanothermobacter sp.]|jgi:hypothetical protein|uniref:Uncharacterized protein n=1 Tax=Methanothermobacter tenebrarum TaxID=680118 RepID=A0ABN6PAI1_9EURY|nr:hypothetical protein [Methanothermobacter tenebrarum]MDD3453891.1 hypothetical protein [Methanobacteriales archaeon]MDI6882766.1 hypothetical protein [Methanothermobacter sp.]MDX9692602.1 hypothetical protein [Methanothermobacter sp.]BDH79237.1 hypothetical protein MTTB_06160 [Methanothermobacter tenebrarum]HHW16239.1 hypothetical protein [Methanothermobacter sp.]
MDTKFLISIFAVMVLLTSCFGCIQWPFYPPANNTTTNPPLVIKTDGGDSGRSSGAQECPNCGYYPWYVGTRCPWCGYGDDDGLLVCPNCGGYTYHATGTAGYRDPYGYCSNCGYTIY